MTLPPTKLDGRAPYRVLFGIERTCAGDFQVIALDTGRPMGFVRPTAASANGMAQSLNAAARNGRLAQALRAS